MAVSSDVLLDPVSSGVNATGLRAGPAECRVRAELPEIPRPRAVGPSDARALSKVLLARLAELDEGSEVYCYVRGTLIELNLSLVRFAARRFGAGNEPLDDLVQVGTIGLIKAVDRFDPDRGVEFTTFAVPTIVGEIKRHFRDTTWAVRVPRRLQELRSVLADARDQLEQRLGHAPTVAQLAEHLSLTEEEVIEGLAASNARIAGPLELPAPEDSGENSLEGRLGIEDPDLARVEDLSSLQPLIAQLPQRERLILSLRFTEELTQADIGRRIGVSQMHVSRLLSRTLGTLRAGLGRD